MKKTILSLSIVALLGTGLTACNKQHSHDDHAHSENNKEAEHTEEHKHDDHGHEGHDHEEQKHDEHEGHDHEEHKHDEHEGHDHDDEKVGHIGKHVHGEAELNIALVDNALTLELNSPSMNVFGFEHKPSTDEQKATVEAQETLLKNAEKLFTISGGDCSIKSVDVDMPFEEHHDEHGAEKEHEHEEHAHKHEEHDHKEEHKDEHKHDEHDHDHAEVHSDVKATYTYNCNKGADITNVQVNVFSQFTGFNKLNTKWINADKQGAETLSKEAYTITFK